MRRNGFLLMALVTAPVAAQPPVLPPREPGVTIRPNQPPLATTAPARPVEKDGMIVFRPQRVGGTATPPGDGTPIPASPAPPAAPRLTASDEPGTLLYDYWFVAAVDGKRIGHLHWTAKEVDRGGRKLWVGTRHQTFVLSRFGQTVTQWGEEGTTETPDGEVVATTFSQGLGNQTLTLNGVVEGNKLRVRGTGPAAPAADTPWPGGVTGVAREPLIPRDKKPKSGESFDYLTYVASLNRVIKATTTVEAAETAVLWPDTPPRPLVRLVSRTEPIENFRLPPSTMWCDAATFDPLMVEFDFPALGGKVTFLRTTKDAATAPVGKPVELFDVQSIRLDREIPDVHNRLSVTYRVTMPKDDDPPSAFAADARQKVANVDPKGKAFDLVVTAVRGSTPSAAPPLPEPGPEFGGSSYFVNWDNDGVKAHARAAVGGLPAGSGAWEKARAVERWVKENMRAVEFSQAMATADHVAQSLSGDCTEYAMLAAAMCRAAGVPSRTALGLVYVPPDRPGNKPVLAYHMWFEVFADGRWLALDATLGRGGVGPGHIKITDASWHNEKSFAPLLPVLRVLTARPAVAVGKW